MFMIISTFPISPLKTHYRENAILYQQRLVLMVAMRVATKGRQINRSICQPINNRKFST